MPEVPYTYQPTRSHVLQDPNSTLRVTRALVK